MARRIRLCICLEEVNQGTRNVGMHIKDYNMTYGVCVFTKEESKLLEKTENRQESVFKKSKETTLRCKHSLVD